MKTAFDMDTLFDPDPAKRQGKLLSERKCRDTPGEAVKMATCDNAQRLKLCDPRDPCPGALGVIEEGTPADLIPVAGNPRENLDLVADPDKNFALLVKDGKISRNAVK